MSDPANRLPPEYDETLPVDYDPQFTADISTKMRVPDKIGVNTEDRGDSMNGGGGGGYDGYMMYSQHEEQRRVAAMDIPDKIVMMGHEQSAGMSDPRMNLHLDLQDALLHGVSTHSTQQYVGLDTPPRVLTLEERPFPNVIGGGGGGGGAQTEQPNFYEEDFEEELLEVELKKGTAAADQHNVSFQNGYIMQTPQKHSNHVPVPASVKNIVNFPISEFIGKWFSFAETGQKFRRMSSDLDPRADLLATPGEGLLIQGDEEDDLLLLKRQVAKLHRHVQRLEVENGKRNSREFVLYPVMAGYFLFRLMQWFMQQH